MAENAVMAVPEIEERKPDIKQKEMRIFDEKTSPNLGKLAGALAKAQGAMINGTKDKQGYGYKYMELGT